MLDWLIIGGGVHGTHLSHVLVHQYGVPADRLKVLDPYDQPLARWRHCTRNTGMKHLRSPVVHHLGVEPMGLLNFSRSGEGRGVADFAAPYERPGLALFEAYNEHLVEVKGLEELRVRGKAEDLCQCAGGFGVETSEGILEAKRVVLAMGAGERCRWPEWAEVLREKGAPVWHIFEDDFEIEAIDRGVRLGVVGLGISGAQVACRLASDVEQVVVFSRHDVQVHQFDSEPCWLGPKCQRGFWQEKNYETRRVIIGEARHRGSMPSDVAGEFARRKGEGAIDHRQGEIVMANYDEGRGWIRLYGDSGEVVEVEALVLATGFEDARPDRTWLKGAMERMSLRCARCGYPVVDRALQWTGGLHVSGPLAELELGPAARNIAGARMTARRLGEVVS